MSFLVSLKCNWLFLLQDTWKNLIRGPINNAAVPCSTHPCMYACTHAYQYMQEYMHACKHPYVYASTCCSAGCVHRTHRRPINKVLVLRGSPLRKLITQSRSLRIMRLPPASAFGHSSSKMSPNKFPTSSLSTRRQTLLEVQGEKLEEKERKSIVTILDSCHYYHS